MHSDSSSSDDERTSRSSVIERKQNDNVRYSKPTTSTTTTKTANSKLFDKLNDESDDDNDSFDDDDDDNNNDNDSDASDDKNGSDGSNDDQSSSSEFSDDDDDDDDIDDQSDQDNETGHRKIDDQLLHMPISERLRHVQMVQGINPIYKEQRKRKYEQSQQQIRAVKEQKLHQQPNRYNKNDTTDTSTAIPSDQTKKKSSKHAPKVMSSKRSDFYHRQRLDIQGGGIAAMGTSIQAHTNVYKGRDPRSMIEMTTSLTNNTKNNHNQRGGKKLLETIRGTTNDYQYEDYAFLQEMRNEEIQKLQKRIKARQLTGRKGQEQRRRYNIQNDDNDGLMEDKKELHRLQQEKANFERKQLDIATKRAVQQQLREGTVVKQKQHHPTSKIDTESRHTMDDHDNVSDHHSQISPPLPRRTAGSKFVPKVRELKRMYLETKYDLLSQQQKGKNTIDKMILKKHKKNKSKDAKKHYI